MLEVKSITKRFGDFTAVNDISFNAEKGEILGFLGPNGAGKSTTMKIITGFLSPSSGSAHLCGHDVLSDKLSVQKNLGYVPENAPLYEEMYVQEFLNFIGKMRNISPSEIEDKIEKTLSMCSIKDVEFQKIETLSKGYKRRVSLAQALLHDPSVLILDEPTDGLDPNQKHDVRALIQKISKEKTILISTHILEEVEEICSRCIIIGQGKILFEGTPTDLKSKSTSGRMQDVFRAITTGQSVEGVKL